ncbi:DUF4293 domain-containing protein [Parasediminibacterium sp. JCM 36343]|uniref:DUF4293 domain-containing protein n=1 Tax=Parasediminibacterium sp. JCM 36343 TaxID=3374279 RepID=UPI0039792FDF
MIQRIQTVWLLLATICAFITLRLSFYSGMKVDDATKATVYTHLNALSTNPLLIITVAIAAAAFVAIFLYKDRKRQLLITAGIAIGAILTIALYFTQIKLYTQGQLNLTSIFSFLIPIFLLLAVRGIWKDEKLVKSTDRLR